MNRSTNISRATGLRIFITTAIASAIAFGVACDSEDGPCDEMCDQGIFGGDVEEVSTPDGQLTCECSRKKPSAEACGDYCEQMGGSADDSSVDGNTCVCESVLDD